MMRTLCHPSPTLYFIFQACTPILPEPLLSQLHDLRRLRFSIYHAIARVGFSRLEGGQNSQGNGLIEPWLDGWMETAILGGLVRS